MHSASPHAAHAAELRTGWARFAVEEACDGRAALERIRGATVKSSLVFLDLAMPEIDGVELVRALSEEASLEATQLVVVCASEVPAAIHSQVLCHLQKPVQLAEVFSLCEGFCESPPTGRRAAGRPESEAANP
jgi:CheY-like chemotaxis protein